MNRANDGGEGKPAVVSSPRLSIRIPRNISSINSKSNDIKDGISNGHPTVTFGEGNLMSPRTTTVSHPSSSSLYLNPQRIKEVPRAAFDDSEEEFIDRNGDGVNRSFSDQLQPTTSMLSEMVEMIPATSDARSSDASEDDDIYSLVEDSIQGLKALAASAVVACSERVSSPPDSEPELNEDEFLGKLFNDSDFKAETFDEMISEFCVADALEGVKNSLIGIVERSDSLLQSKGISMSLRRILLVYLNRLMNQESLRTGRKNFSALLRDESFTSASAVVLILLPRLVTILIPVEEALGALRATAFDVLLAIEPVIKAIPELLRLVDLQRRLKLLQDALLESFVWKKSSILHGLLSTETQQTHQSHRITGSTAVISTISGIRACQRALETLAGSTVSSKKPNRLEIFFRKYLRLSAQRIQYACLRLGLSSSVCQLTWEFFFELIKSEGCEEQRKIFMDRNLNQILVAVLYCCSHLLNCDRAFLQISQVLPFNLPKTEEDTEGEEVEEDIYTFYNDKIVSCLRNQILKRFPSGESLNDQSLLNGLFMNAPFPANPVHQLSTNVSIVRMNQRKRDSMSNNNNNNNNNNNINNHNNKNNNITKYEWKCPYSSNDYNTSDTINSISINTSNNNNNNNNNNSNNNNKSNNDNTNDDNSQTLPKAPQTPSNTSLLLSMNLLSDPVGKKRPATTENSENDEKFRRVAKRLDFDE